MADACEIPRNNATSDEIRQILTRFKTIAVVGISEKPDRPSYRVAEYLQKNGYRIIPVNPVLQEVFGEKAYPDLKSIPEKVEIVDIFRKPDAVPDIVDQAIQIGAKVIWMQENIVHNTAADKARNAGLQVVMNKCILKEHANLG